MLGLFGRNKRRDEGRQEPVIGPPAGDVQGEADSWDVHRGVFDAAPTAAGQEVNEKTAMRTSAVYACVRLIAGAIASFPAHIYRRTGAGERERVEHSYWRLLNQQPSPAYSAATMWEFLTGQMLLRGDGLAYLARNRGGDVTNIIPLRRNQAVIERKVMDDPREPHRLKYFITTPDGAFGADQDDILHLPGFGFDGVNSMSVIEWGARNSTGISIAADDHAGKFFGNGAQIEHVIKAVGKMTESQQEALRAAWVAKYSGKGPTGVPLILTEGLDLKELTMTARDAQLLETRQWNVIDVCRAFGVPPFMVGETTKSTSWGSGIEQMGIGFVVYTAAPHAKRFQQELNKKLFGRQSPYFVEFSMDGLMQGDHSARAEYYTAALGGTQNPAWMTPNEVRKLENLPPIEGGDELSKPEPSNEGTESSAQPPSAAEG